MNHHLTPAELAMREKDPDWTPYSLPRDPSERSRLDLQHTAWSAAVNYLLHPRIRASLPCDAQSVNIAEVGTGTGVWLHELSASCPTGWTFTGYDISDAQFPTAVNGASHTVRFEILNILTPIPEHLKGTCDVVHIRLLVCGLVGADWTTLAKNVLELLKPGGWIHWHEGDLPSMKVLQSGSGASTRACKRLVELGIANSQRVGKFMPHDVVGLFKTVAAAGYEDCAVDEFASDRVAGLRETISETMWKALMALSRYAVESTGAEVAGVTAE